MLAFEYIFALQRDRMSRKRRKGLIITFFMLFLASYCPVLSQEIKVTLGPDEIGENQAWTITVTVNDDRLKNYDVFPDIDGFKKRGTSTQSQTSIVNGQISSSQSVVMTYLPTNREHLRFLLLR